MKQYMLDTNTVSDFIKAQPNVTKHVLSVPMASICISSITQGELVFGLAKRPDAKHLHTVVREFLRRVDVLTWNTDTAECYGLARAEMERCGKILSPLDLLIATHALEVDAIMVTHDQAFSFVNGLDLQDWTK